MTTDGDTWAHYRRLLLPFFSRSQVGNLILLEKHVNNLIGNIPKDGSTIDLQQLFFYLTLDITSEAFCGESTACLTSESSASTGAQFSKAFDLSQRTVRNCLYFGSLAAWAPFATFRKNRNDVK